MVGKATGVEPMKQSIPLDERSLISERATGEPLISPAVRKNAASPVCLAQSRVAARRLGWWILLRGL